MRLDEARARDSRVLPQAVSTHGNVEELPIVGRAAFSVLDRSAGARVVTKWRRGDGRRKKRSTMTKGLTGGTKVRMNAEKSNMTLDAVLRERLGTR